MDNARLLIVEDHDEIARMMDLFFAARGFKVSVAADGQTALRMVRESLPSLILIDIGLPDFDGYELLTRLRENRRTRYLPVIFVTQRSKKFDRLAGLQLGADDYVTKPFDLEELCLRAQNAVARAARENLASPLTGLPAQKVTEEEMAAARCRPDRAMLEFHLRHAEEFRELYGALALADLLRYLALMLNGVLNTLGGAEDFLGQTAADVFVVLTLPERVAPIRQAVLERFDRDVVHHYNLPERCGDNVKVRDASGQEHVLPLLRLEAVTVR